jgi:3-oxoacyl-[acyl-carrier protein] reductase
MNLLQIATSFRTVQTEIPANLLLSTDKRALFDFDFPVILSSHRNENANVEGRLRILGDFYLDECFNRTETVEEAVVATLTGKSALVTGGSRGIGAAIVLRLAKEGASVAFTYSSSTEQANSLAEQIAKNGGKALAIKADAADQTAVRAAVQQAAEHFGKIDILVNNAGIIVLGPITEIKEADFQHILAVNVHSVFTATQEAVLHMPEGGRIIHIGSVNSDRMPFVGGSVYALTKGAIFSFTKGLARDLGPRNITVNNIQPGPIDTDANPANGPFAETMLGLMALKRYGKAEEIAGMVSYLAGPEAAYITGASLLIDGGFDA